MPSVLPTLLRLLTVLVVAVGVVVFASHAVPTGGPAPADSAQPWGDAGHDGHSHDDGDRRDRPAGHGHSHNPADHSHDSLASASLPAPSTGEPAAVWRRSGHDRDAGDAPDPLDRPPRSALA